MNMIKDKHFIFTGLQAWDLDIGSNAKDIAIEISKYNKVLYVNYPFDWKNFIKLKKDSFDKTRANNVNKRQHPLKRINNNLWVLDLPFFIYPTNILPDGSIFDYINKKNNIKIFNYINYFVKKLAFSNIIHFNDNDIYRSFYSKEILKPSLSIYYRRDNLLNVPYWKKHAHRLEPLLIMKSDLVVTNSVQFAKYSQLYNKNSFDIGQGVDLKLFNYRPYPTPNDIKDIPRPIIGYTGLLTSLRLDINLIYDLVKVSPNYSFVFVGKEDHDFSSHEIHKMNNVHFTGEKNIKEIPNYIYSFDICINPQLTNEVTIGNYPRKIDEYLSLGKPIIATNTCAMKIFKNHIHLCTNIEEYQSAIKECLNEHNNDYLVKSRIEFAKTHTWEESVKKLYKYIELHLNCI